MGKVKNVVEPATIALLFTIGTLVNRRGRRPKRYSKSIDLEAASKAGQTINSTADLNKGSQRYRNTLPSVILSTFPFLLEIVYWLLTYFPYQMCRARSALHILRDPAPYNAMALAHARTILAIESALHIAVEAPLQSFILRRCPWFMKLLSTVYLSHILVGITFLVYGYTFFPLKAYKRVRRTLFLDNWISFVVISVYRCMPPRLMPTEYGFVDIMHPPKPGQQAPAAQSPGDSTSTSSTAHKAIAHALSALSSSSSPPNPATTQPQTWSNNKFQLTIAAMPSLHFGTALLLGATLYTYAPHRPARLFGLLWPAAMLLTVLATANHWVLDCVAGAAVVALGYSANEILCRLAPIEDRLYACFRTARPVD
ncbi:MAG: hypothetical protein M1819_000056 [Sarea resinae]|nr:MAG: hypothetical protein M1819_000056 [Sarea resinae]